MKTQRYLWVVEVFFEGEWMAWESYASREQARDVARGTSEKTRVVKYVPAD